MNKVLVVLTAIPAFLAGLAVAQLGHDCPKLVVPQGSPPALAPLSPLPAVSPVHDEERLRLVETVERQRIEIDALTARLASAPGAHDAPALRPVAERAAELYELFARTMNNKRKPRDEDLVEALSRLKELTPEMASWFAARYRESKDEAAMMLTLLSGGPDAGDFILELATDPSTPQPHRNQVLRSLAGIEEMPSKCQAGDRLLAWARESVRSEDAMVRAAAAGAFGRAQGAVETATLRTLAESDPAEMVQRAALIALGRTGDRETLDYLKTYLSRDGLGERTRETVEMTIEDLEKRLKQ